jgi:hypothetical protein
MSEFDFSRSEQRLRRAAAGGLARAGASLADALRARGLHAEARENSVRIEGAGLIAREFGTLSREAQPVVAPVVRAHAQEIVRLIAAEIRSPASSGEALGQRRVK